MITLEMQKKIDIFFDYLETDELGDWTGLSSDAPENAKIAYREFEEEQKRANDKGVMI